MRSPGGSLRSHAKAGARGRAGVAPVTTNARGQAAKPARGRADARRAGAGAGAQPAAHGRCVDCPRDCAASRAQPVRDAASPSARAGLRVRHRAAAMRYRDRPTGQAATGRRSNRTSSSTGCR
jgi:hypothetical protein